MNPLKKLWLAVFTGDTPKAAPSAPPTGSVLRQQFATYLRGEVYKVIGVFNPQLVDTSRRLQMRDDPDVAFALNILGSAIVNAQWAVESDDPEIKAAMTAEMTRSYRQLAKAGKSAIGIGYQVVEKIMEARSMDIEIEDGEGASKTSMHIPVWWGYKEFKAIDPRSIVLHINPDTDQWDGVQQWVTGLGITGNLNTDLIGPERVALWSFRKDEVFGRLTGYAMLDQAYSAWWDKQAITMFANRYFERRADPTPVGRAEPTAFGPAGEEIDGFEKMASIIGNLKNGGTLVLPNKRDEKGEYSFALDFLKDDKRGDMYEAYLKYKNEQIQLGLLTPPRVGKASGGSQLGSKEPQVQADQMSEFLESIAHDWLDEFVNPQIVRPIGIYNYGQERFERSNTRVVVSGISADVKSLLKESLFKQMDFESVAGTGKRLPIALQMSASGIIKTLGIPAPSPDDLKQMEADAAAEAQLMQDQAQQAVDAKSNAPAVAQKDENLDRELLSFERMRDEIIASVAARVEASLDRRADAEALKLDKKPEVLAAPAPQPMEVHTHMHIDKGAIEANVEIAPTQVDIQAPITVAPPNVTVNQGDTTIKADLNLKPGDKKTVEFKRDAEGNIIDATITPTPKPEGGAK